MFSVYLLNYLLTSILSYLITPWSRVHLENLIGSQLVKISPHFMEPQVSLPHSKVPADCPFTEPARSSPHHHIQIPKDSYYYYYPPIYAWFFQVVSFPHVSSPKPIYSSTLPHTFYMPRLTHSFLFDHLNNNM